MGWTTFTNDSYSRDSLAGAYDSSANLTYALDGDDGGACTAFAYGSDSWSSIHADTARAGSAAAYDSNANVTYSIDGDTGTVSTVLTIYTEGSNSWTSGHVDSTARWYLAAAYDSSANLTYAIDGDTVLSLSSPVTTGTVTAYAHGSNTWTSEATDNSKFLVAAAHDNSANLTYSIGGWTSTRSYATSAAYAESSNSWSAITYTAFAAHAAAYNSYSNLTVAADGYVGAGTYVYTEGNNTWTYEDNDPDGARSECPGAYDSSANFVYVIDGLSSGDVDLDYMAGFHYDVTFLKSLSATLSTSGAVNTTLIKAKLTGVQSFSTTLVVGKNGHFTFSLPPATLGVTGALVMTPQKTLSAALSVVGSLVPRTYAMIVGFIPIKRYP